MACTFSGYPDMSISPSPRSADQRALIIVVEANPMVSAFEQFFWSRPVARSSSPATVLKALARVQELHPKNLVYRDPGAKNRRVKPLPNIKDDPQTRDILGPDFQSLAR